MLERVAKARFDGDIDAAVRLFRWAVSIVDSRSRASINDIEVDSPLMEMDPWLHLDVEGGGKDVRLCLVIINCTHIFCTFEQPDSFMYP